MADRIDEHGRNAEDAQWPANSARLSEEREAAKGFLDLIDMANGRVSVWNSINRR